MAIKIELEPEAVAAGLADGRLEWAEVNGQRVLRPTAKFNAILKKRFEQDRRLGIDHVEVVGGKESAHRKRR